jgi:undecaprenyl-diphosphatase
VPRRPSIRSRRTAPITTATLALTAFALIAALDEPSTLDLAAYDWAARNYHRALVLAQRPIEFVGLPGIYIPLALLLARQLKRKRRRGGRSIANAAIGGWLALRVSRMFIHRPRPPRPPGRGPKSESTFPSGHTTGVTALSIVVARVLRDERILTSSQAALVGYGWPIVTALNRVYVREHWVTDVIAGWLLGTSAGSAVLSLR